MRQHIRAFSFLASALLIAGCGGSLRVNEAPTRSPLPVPAAANPVDESRMVTLRGNVHPLARPEFDQGLANPATRLDRMLLVLNSSPTQHADLDALLAAQQDSQIRPSITSGSRQPNSVRASARRTQISRKSQPGSRRRDSLSTKSPPAAGSSPSPVQPHKSPQHSTRLCTSTVSTEPTTSPMRRTRRFPSACQA